MNTIQTSNDDKMYLYKQPKRVIRDDILYEINETEKTASIIDTNFVKDDIFIPRAIKYKAHEYSVTKILKGSFSNSHVRSIKFPLDSELRSIEENSFDYSKLTSIRLPSSLTELAEGWCRETNNLINVQVHPNNLHFKSYNDEMILGKSNKDSEIFDVIIFVQRGIKTITIPSQITEISAYSFEYSDIYKIDIPQKVTKICKYAFKDCHKLSEINFHIDSELKTIEEYAFVSTQIESITIPSSVCELKDCWCTYLKMAKVTLMPNNPNFKNYQDKLILGKTNKESEIFDKIVFVQRNTVKSIEIPSNITTISPYSFANSNLEEVVFSPDITCIGDNAFDKCYRLTSVVFPQDSKLQIIGSHSFEYTNLNHICIPKSVKTICSYAFTSCEKLEQIEFPIDSELQEIGGSFILFSPVKNLTIPSKVSKLNTNWCWGINETTNLNVMENSSYLMNYKDMILGKTNIHSDVYDDIVFVKRDAKKISIPSNIKRINSYAFARSSITGIFIPKSVIEICEGAFDQIKKLKYVKIEENSELRTIGRYSFLMTLIEKIVIPKHITVIENRTFDHCKHLKRVEIPEDSELRIIKDDAFQLTSIYSIFIPKNVTQINNNAFTNSMLKIFQIEEGSGIQLNIKKVFGNNENIIILVPKQVSDNFII